MFIVDRSIFRFGFEGMSLRSCVKRLRKEWRRHSFIVLRSVSEAILIFLDSSMVEHAAVNRGVVGSSPTRGVVGAVVITTAPYNFGQLGALNNKVSLYK